MAISEDWYEIRSTPLLITTTSGSVIQDRDDPAYWADEPSHPLCEALDQVAVIFLKHLGRMPSKEEIAHGVETAMDSMGLAALPKHAPRPNSEQKETVDRLYPVLDGIRESIHLTREYGDLLADLMIPEED